MKTLRGAIIPDMIRRKPKVNGHVYAGELTRDL